MKKIGFSVLALVLILLIGGVVYIKTNLNSIVKSAMEKYGSEITQTDVTVKDVSISLTTGDGTVKGIHIGNPKSFFAARAMDVGSVTLHLDTGTVAGKGPIIIDTVNIDSPQITYEINATGDANLAQLQKNIGHYSSSSAKTSSSAPSRPVIIKNLYIRNGEVSVTNFLLGGREVTTSLPTIHLTDIGAEGKTLTAPQVAQVVLGEMVMGAARSGASAVTKELGTVKNLGEDAVTKTKDALTKFFDR